jgi:hypothetical protein
MGWLPAFLLSAYRIGVYPMLQALMLQALPVNATADLNGVPCNAIRRKLSHRAQYSDHDRVVAAFNR